jgi:hypothetical protein
LNELRLGHSGGAVPTRDSCFHGSVFLCAVGKALEHFLGAFLNRIRTRTKKTLSHPLGIGSSAERTHTVLLVVHPKVFETVQVGPPILAEEMLDRGNVPHQSLPEGSGRLEFLATS